MPDLSSPTDRLLGALDQALRTLAARPAARRASPAATLPPVELDQDERRASAALMRVNHAGEVAAQALYLGQSIGARSAATRSQLLGAASEERDHLSWCADRLAELGARPSLLTPAWFAASFALGAVAGAAGDATSLGFVAETERQVEAHLADHLSLLPRSDSRSAAILSQMAHDEARHGNDARAAGGREPPATVRSLMRFGGNILRTVALRL